MASRDRAQDDAPEPTEAPPPRRPGGSRRTRQRSRLARAARTAGFAVAALVGLLLGFVGLLHTGPGQRFVRDQLAERISARMKGSLRIGELDFALFGDLGLRRVSLRDEAGRELIALDELEVEPDWSSLASGTVAFERIRLDGLRIALRQDADGQLDLGRLFAQEPAELPPAEPEAAKEPKDLRLRVAALHLGGIDLSLEKADGTRIALRGFGLDGSVEARPKDKTVRVALARLGAGLALEKKADGVRLALADLETALQIELVQGTGRVELGPTRAHVRLEQRGAPQREADLDLGPVRLDLEPSQLGAAVDGLVAGAVALEAISLRGRTEGGELAGAQQVQLVGLRVDAAELNRLVGRELLGSDVDVAAKLAGPPERLALDTTVSTGGGTLGLRGTIDLSDRGQPRFDLRLEGSGLDARRLVRLDRVPNLTIDELTLALRGCGASREDAAVDLGLYVDRLVVDRYEVDGLLVGAHYEGGRLRVDPLVVSAVEQEVVARGEVDLERQELALELTLAGDVGRSLAALRAAGLPISARLAPGAIAYRRGVITLAVQGELAGALDARLAIRELGVAGGTVSGDVHAKLQRNAHPAPGEPAVKLAGVDGHLDLAGVSLGQVAALRGRKLAGLTGTLGGRVELGGTPEAPEATYRLEARIQPHEGPGLELHAPTVVAQLRGRATKTGAALGLAIEGQNAARKDALLAAEVELPLELTGTAKGIAPHRPLRVELHLAKRDFAELLPYLPERLKVDPATGEPRALPAGQIALDVKLGGTPAAPEGTVSLDARVAALPGATQRLQLGTTVRPEGSKVVAETELGGWLDASAGQALAGRSRIELSRSPLVPGPRTLSWTVGLAVPEQDLSKLPLGDLQNLGISGRAGATIELRGNDSDLFGKIGLALDDVVFARKGPLSGTVGVEVTPTATSLATDLRLGGADVLRTRGGVARSGTGLLAALRDPSPNRSLVDKLGNPAVDLDLEIPDHPLGAYAGVNPRIASLPGQLGGRIHVGGDLRTPTARGALGYHGFSTLDGQPGAATVELDAGEADLGATVKIGARRDAGGRAPVEIGVQLSRPGLLGYLAAKRCYATAAEAARPGPEPAPSACPEGASLPVAARVAAEDVDLRSLVPAFALEGQELGLAGRLRWTLDGRIVLDPKPRQVEIGGRPVTLPPLSPESTLAGELALRQGALALPGTSRRLHDVELRLVYGPRALELRGLTARESDLERNNRRLDVEGRLSLADWLPEAVRLRVKTDRWLVHGTKNFGPTDAPRGTLSADIGVVGDLSRPVKKLEIEVAALELLVPDRFDRAHEPEQMSLGDVIFLDETLQPPGKLPVSAAALERTAEDPFAPAPTRTAAAGPESGLDVHIAVPSRIHFLQFPMDLYGSGAIDVRRRESGTKVQGKLTWVDGSLALGGRQHQLQKGHFLFDAEYPGGFLELWFARREHNATLRDISAASGGELVKIHMKGPLDNRKTTLSGAGSPGTLFDLLSVHNAGRPRYVTQPDLPATPQLEYPQHPNLLLLSYLASNVPHMLFLDRIAAWSDGYDDRGTNGYGEVRHLEAARYNEAGTLRVRAEAQPAGAGQSDAELGVDWLWVNTAQTAVGVGLGAGSRLGGGPGIFLEWSSKD